MEAKCTIPERVIAIKELIMNYIYNDETADDLVILAEINKELDMIKFDASMMEYKLRKVAELAEKKD